MAGSTMTNAEGLSKILNEKTCIVGMGNTFRNDDAVGVLIAERLLADKTLPGNLTVMNVEDVIESHVFRIAEGDSQNVLLVDAVECSGEEPGSFIFGKLDELDEIAGGFSTHKLSLSVADRILKEHGKTTYLLGIVSGNVDYGNQISPVMLGSAETVIELIRTTRSG